jgi:hypothetical protein
MPLTLLLLRRSTFRCHSAASAADEVERGLVSKASRRWQQRKFQMRYRAVMRLHKNALLSCVVSPLDASRIKVWRLRAIQPKSGPCFFSLRRPRIPLVLASGKLVSTYLRRRIQQIFKYSGHSGGSMTLLFWCAGVSSIKLPSQISSAVDHSSCIRTCTQKTTLVKMPRPKAFLAGSLPAKSAPDQEFD